MNTAVYQEPYKFPAGVLALMVHAAFFSLLYFGFSWQTQLSSPAVMSVELWLSLPESVAAAPVTAPPVKAVVEIPHPVQPEVVIKPDIVIPEKKLKIKPEVVKPVHEVKPEVKPRAKPETKFRLPPGINTVSTSDQAVSAATQQAGRARAVQEAATGRVVDEYSGKIRAKIKGFIVQPPNVANDARAEFEVTVLPGGTVLPPRLLKSSGNATYDTAVERAILKSQPLPLPPDAGLFSRFRELKLSFKPVE
ncbi:MAG: TonB C-terminal domain-containing protein [Proteobacteria bacterium]|nr:TonB C-terminal domain-containing protein [Pseudomonadota bacterium]